MLFEQTETDNLSINVVEAYLQVIEELGLDKREVINKTFCALQDCELHDENGKAMFIDNPLNDEMHVFLFSSFKGELKEHPNLLNAFKKVATHYLLSNTLETPGILRELFLQALNIPFITTEGGSEPSISFVKQKNIYYMLGKKLKYTRAGNLLNCEMYSVYRSFIPSIEFLSTLPDETTNEVKLFPSLYQAIEHANQTTLERQFDGEPRGYVPTLWAVQYLNDIPPEKFHQETLTLYPETFAPGLYNPSKRIAVVNYATVPRQDITPLVGTVILESSHFSNFYMFNRVAFQNLPIRFSDKYHPEFQGSSVIYSRFFAESRALLSGQRKLFANTRAWLSGTGSLFTDSKAILLGERPLFANTRASLGLLETKNDIKSKYKKL